MRERSCACVRAFVAGQVDRFGECVHCRQSHTKQCLHTETVCVDTVAVHEVCHLAVSTLAQKVVTFK